MSYMGNGMCFVVIRRIIFTSLLQGKGIISIFVTIFRHKRNKHIQENLLDAAQVSKLYGEVWHPDRFPAPRSAGNRPHTYAASTPASPDRPRTIFIRQFPS